LNLPVDLRSDTVTLPSPAMRQAMYEAELGDDGYGEDRTVARLYEIVAETVGKEAALLTPSGCMANLISLLTFCDRGSEVILGRQTDMYLWEVGAMSAVGGIYPNPIENGPDGTIDLTALEASLRPDDVHFPRTRLICLENSHNLSGGTPLTPRYIGQVRQVADSHHLPLYLDGARLFNASVALRVDPREITRHADALMFCFSKGLSCPVGSIVCGSHDFIESAHRQRKMLGGQMRQAGVIAAAAIVAMNEMIARLADDHEHARLLASGLSALDGLDVRPEQPQTNIVFFKPARPGISTEAFASRLEAAGVRTLPMGDWLRAVTHYGIEAEDIHKALQIIAVEWKDVSG
jgi:threonine aldolase